MYGPLAPAFAVAFVFLTADAASTDDTKSAAAFLMDWAEAWQSNDVDKMMSFYHPSKGTTAVESLGRIRHGNAQIRKMYVVAFDELIFDRVTLKPIAIGHEASVAWATCRYKAEMRLKSDNRRLVLEVLGSFVMSKENDAWKITLEHFSVIPDVPRVRQVENEKSNADSAGDSSNPAR